MIKAAPILKWAGGKRQLLPELLARIPASVSTYYEPFVGGGALIFELANQRRFKHAILNDANPELVNLYRVVRDDVDALIDALRPMAHSEADYYRVREAAPADPIEQAARTIYLNRTGFNGLYRVNRKGKFNVPFGKYKNPTICDEDSLRAASRALLGVGLVAGDFEQAVVAATPGDFVYFDPPYLPVSQTSSFANYHREAFGRKEHERLALCCKRLRRTGVDFLLSNSDSPVTREVFADLHIEAVSARRNINCKGSKRGAVGELLVSRERKVAAA